MYRVGRNPGVAWVLAAGSCVFPWPDAAAQSVEVSVRGCEQGVHLVARGASLSHVVRRLSEVLGFRVVSLLDSDPLVSINTTRHPAVLLTKLWPDGVYIAQQPDPACAGKDRVTTVWLLREGHAVPSTATGSRSAPGENQQRLNSRQAMEQFLRAHGVDTPGAE